MKGLIIKEMYTLRQYWKLYLLYLLVFGGVAVLSGQLSFSTAMSTVLVFSLPLTTFAVDEQCSWNRMAVAMPLSRRQIVGSKYLVMLLVTVLGLAIQLVTLLAVVLFGQGELDVADFFIGMLASMASILFVMMVVLPIIFKYNSEKGRMIAIFFFGICFAGVMAIATFTSNNGGTVVESSAMMPVTVVAIVVVALVIVTAVSYAVSCRLYARKEF